MKRILILFALCASVISLSIDKVSAQHVFKFGVKAGVLINTETLKFQNGISHYSEKSTKPGFEIGLQMSIDIPRIPIVIQPEIVYSRVSASYPTGDANFGDINMRFNNIEIPLLVGVRLSIVRILLGPVFTVPIVESANVGAYTEKFAPRYKNFIMGYQIGAGVDIKRFTLDVRYYGLFTDITEDNYNAHNNTVNASMRNSRFSISMGFNIFRL